MRYFEPEAFTFEDYESSFEIFERPDYEATVGGIPERDYLRWVQFSLNMYFKKTALRGPVAEDGKELNGVPRCPGILQCECNWPEEISGHRQKDARCTHHRQ